MLALAALALPSYTIVDLGAPHGAERVEAGAINNRGEVVVQAWESVVVPWFSSKGEKGEGRASFWRGYLWRSGRLLSLGEAPRADTFEPPSIVLHAVNDRSVAVGWNGTGMPVFLSGLSQNVAVLCRGRGAEDLGAGPTSDALGINNLGDVVGAGGHRAFARLRGKIVWLPPLSRIVPADPSGEMNDANQSSAVAINDRRQILMDSTYGTDAESYQRPYLLDGNGSRRARAPSPCPTAIERLWELP